MLSRPRSTGLTPNEASWAIFAGTLALAGTFAALSAWVAPRVIEAGWSGRSLAIINGLFEGREDHSLTEYLSDWRRLWPGLCINLAGMGALVLVLARPESRAVARRVFGSTGREVFHATPKSLIGVVIVSLGVSEWYPFSQFPMYSRFPDEGGYVFLTDGTDEPVGGRSEVGLGMDRVSKIFQENVQLERRLRGLPGSGWYLGSAQPKDEVAVAAAIRTLRYLQDQLSPTRTPAKLWRARVTLKEGAILRERELLAELPGR